MAGVMWDAYIAMRLPRAILHPEFLALKQQDIQLSRALTTSKRVGNLLLKVEEEEVKKVGEVAAELLSKHK